MEFAFTLGERVLTELILTLPRPRHLYANHNSRDSYVTGSSYYYHIPLSLMSSTSLIVLMR